MNRITKFITARATSWIVLVVAVLAAGLLFAAGSGATEETSPGVGLPASAESARAAAAQEDLESADSTSALFVFSREGGELTDSDIEAVTAASVELAEFSP
ncbi:MAG: MMPL family transporter, partial [Salinibacterium sp.]|nr:MMPL family transporter [Salinibacterium sp.]